MSQPATPAPGGGSEDEPLAVPCARHPKVETLLRCGRCETPICPRCMVNSPVGARCPTCARVKKVALAAKPREIALGAVVGLATALVGGIMVLTVPLLGILGLVGAGYVVSETVSRAANRKRGWDIALLALATFLVGIALSPAALALMAGRVVSPALAAGLALALLSNPLVLLGLAVGGVLIWSRLR